MATLEVIRGDDHHLVIETPGKVHVVPVTLIKRWIDGEVEPDAEITRVVLKEWLNSVRLHAGMSFKE